jgi:hypothetical protein
VFVAAAVLEARDQPSTYSPKRPSRHVPTIVDRVVSFTSATDDVMVTLPPPLATLHSAREPAAEDHARRGALAASAQNSGTPIPTGAP